VSVAVDRDSLNRGERHFRSGRGANKLSSGERSRPGIVGMAVAPHATVRCEQPKTRRGFSLIELVVVIGILSAMATVAMPRREPGIFALRTAQSTFVADMRTARARAISRAVHFRVEITDAQSYEVLEMMEGGGGWTQAGDPEVSRTLPPTVSFSGGIGEGYEFNTRGLLAEPTTATTLTLVDSTTGKVRTVDIWPSGQVVAGEGL
jgi:prepilin-type N-terminal cleavage/methylation domain-containing protein